jgi:hypothetical protein
VPRQSVAQSNVQKEEGQEKHSQVQQAGAQHAQHTENATTQHANWHSSAHRRLRLVLLPSKLPMMCPCTPSDGSCQSPPRPAAAGCACSTNAALRCILCDCGCSWELHAYATALTCQQLSTDFCATRRTRLQQQRQQPAQSVETVDNDTQSHFKVQHTHHASSKCCCCVCLYKAHP